MTKRLMTLILAVVMAAALIPAAGFAVSDVMYVYTENGKGLNVRSDPSVSNNVIGSLPYGAAVSVSMPLASGWTAINWSAGSVAYVQSRFLLDYAPAPRPTSRPVPVPTAVPSGNAAKTLSDMNAEFRSARKVTAPYTVISRPARASGWVNLRWAPSTETERIATCPQGKQLTVIAEMTNWYQVQDPATGMIGFISRQYVTRQY